MRFVKMVLMLGAAACWQANAQVPAWDSSGNGLLNGTYYFREVIYLVADSTGDLSRAIATYGTITFNGAGGYSIPNATVVDSSAGTLQTLTTSGTYTTGANGYTFFTKPISPAITGTGTVYGLVANGIFVGSTTEDGFNDLFIAAPIGSQATNSAFQGPYTVSAFFPGGTPSTAADGTFQLSPDGAGNLGTVNINGYYGGGGTSQITQSSSNVKYTFTNGAGVITFPTSTTANFYSGQEYMYISSDRNFIFGGSPQSFDMFVGVKNNASGVTPNFSGIYYEAGLDQDASTLASSGYAAFDTFFGSYNVSGGNIVGHERLFTPLFNSNAEGFTYAATYPNPISGNTYTSGGTQYTFGNGGAIRIGFGIGPTMAISVGLQAPAITSTGTVFLNPMGVTNAASFAPFTAGISPGEFIVLYGSNLAPSTAVATTLPFPQKLNGVSVTVDGLPAPIYYVSPTQISIIVPYAVSVYPVATIVVSNAAGVSNTISQQVNLTTPGIFTLNANGLGYGAIEHGLSGAVVTASNPAQPGEVVSVYVSGLGGVFPPVTEGTAASATTLSNTTNTFTAYVNGAQATVQFAGLVPGLAGLYQMNIMIPSTAASGDNSIEIFGPDSDNYQALIPIGSGTVTASERPATESVVRVRAHRSAKPMTPACASVLCSR